MPLVELTDYRIRPKGTGNGLSGLNFSLSHGDAVVVETKFADDAALFLKALATLVVPEKGVYRFDDKIIDLSSYRKALPCKKRIGYVAQDTALVSNRTIRENLLMMRFFYENRLSLSLDQRAVKLCRWFELTDKLDLKPGEVDSHIRLNAIVVRELCKRPDILLLDRPEDVMDRAKFDLFQKILGYLLSSKLSIVFYTANSKFSATFARKKITLGGARPLPSNRHEAAG